MSGGPYYYDPARAPPPSAGYAWPQPYPPGPPGGYGAPQSPTAQTPMSPTRPHTTAPFPGQSQYGPPPGGPGGPYHYGPAPGGPPPAQAPATPSEGPYPGPPAPPSKLPELADLSQDTLRALLEQLQKTSLTTPQAPPTPGASTAGASPPFPQAATQAPPPHGYGVPPHMQHHQYPYYPQQPPPGSAHGDHERSPPPSRAAPQGYPQVPTLTMPGSFGVVPEAPAPPPSKTPGPRPEPSRKPSKQTSEFSYASSNNSPSPHEMWGPLVDFNENAGNEPNPAPKLQGLYKGIADYIIMQMEPRGSIVVTIPKLIKFYELFIVEGEDRGHWKAFFTHPSYGQLSMIFTDLMVDHHIIPIAAGERPQAPAITPRGFETWMFTLLMSFPDRESRRLAKVVDAWKIFDVRANDFVPRVLPRECFPKKRDERIYQGWTEVTEDFADESEEDEPNNAPRMLEGQARGRAYSVHGSMAPPPLQPPPPGPPADAPAPAPAPPPHDPRKRTGPRPYPGPEEYPEPPPVESPTTERYTRANPYAAAAPNPAVWREDVNPRPTLGESDPAAGPPRRARSTKGVRPTGAGQPQPQARPAKPRRGRSVRPPRTRELSPGAGGRYPSDDEEEGRGYPEGYGRKYDGDGLYDDPSLPLRTTTPGGHRHHREQSRPPPGRGRPERPEKDIASYSYQDQYEKENRPPGSQSTRRSGRWA